MLFVDFKCWSYMTNSDESYMTYVIYDQFGMPIYDQHNFLTNFAELFMAPTPLLVSTFDDTGERGRNYSSWHVKVFKFIWYAQKILLNDSILSLYKQYLKNMISMCKQYWERVGYDFLYPPPKHLFWTLLIFNWSWILPKKTSPDINNNI